jgi:hypothetical protein
MMRAGSHRDGPAQAGRRIAPSSSAVAATATRSLLLRGDADYAVLKVGTPGLPPSWHRSPVVGKPHRHCRRPLALINES